MDLAYALTWHDPFIFRYGSFSDVFSVMPKIPHIGEEHFWQEKQYGNKMRSRSRPRAKREDHYHNETVNKIVCGCIIMMSEKDIVIVRICPTYEQMEWNS